MLRPLIAGELALMKRWIFALAAACAAFSPAAFAAGSNPYGVAIRINDRVITNFEIKQRVLLLRAFGSSGDLQKLAEKQLVDERLRLQAAEELGLDTNEEDITAGIDEFGARGNLTGAQLLQYIKSRGAEPESMRDFVRSGLLWRQVVQARYGAKANVSDTELDTTLNLVSGQVQESVLISEIQLPLGERGNEKTLALAKRLSQTIKTEGAFSAAARRYSRAPSRSRGGRLNWVPVAGLPPALAGQILALNPGEVTAPVTLSKTVGIFQLRAVRQDKATAQTKVSISYTQVTVPTEKGRGAEHAAKLIAAVDTCADLRAKSERFGENAYTDHTLDQSEIPASTALALANLDRQEASYYTTASGAIAVVMVCDRLRDLPEGTRENIRNALFNRRISSFGDGYLQELRGDAVIIHQ